MSLVAVRNALITTIVNAGKWSASQISTCDFGIAELSASVVILQPGPGTTIVPLAYGDLTSGSSRIKQYNWDITGIIMVKDTGDAKTLLSRLWQAADDIDASINDDGLGGAVDAANLQNISRPSIDSFINDGNTDYAFITFSVLATEYK